MSFPGSRAREFGKRRAKHDKVRPKKAQECSIHQRHTGCQELPVCGKGGRGQGRKSAGWEMIQDWKTILKISIKF